MKVEIQAYSIQELGSRQNQEDFIFPAYDKSTSADRLFILCDGVGGHDKGEVASSVVCNAISKYIHDTWSQKKTLTDEILQNAINEAYNALDKIDHGGTRKMGTTLTVLCLHANGATIAHIGDSRVYQLRPASSNKPAEILFRTQDHSLVNELIKAGDITEEEALTHPQRNVILRAMQPHQTKRAKADITHITDIKAGDYFYLCSDGMLENMNDKELLSIITQHDLSNEEKICLLKDYTAGNQDNHTAHLIQMTKVVKDNPMTRILGFKNQSTNYSFQCFIFSCLTILFFLFTVFYACKACKKTQEKKIKKIILIKKHHSENLTTTINYTTLCS